MNCNKKLGGCSVKMPLKCTIFLEYSSSHLAQTERPNPKLLSRGGDRSSLKYIISVLLSDFEYFIEK